MRFLCLHGGSTSAEIFEIQSGGLTQPLESLGHKFHFINGRLESDCEPGMERTHLPNRNFHSSILTSHPELRGIISPPFHNHYPRGIEPGSSLKYAIEYTLRMIAREGPFDAVMGFSQGAALAYSLLEHHAQTKGDDAPPLFKAAVFICAPVPYDLSGREREAKAETETATSPGPGDGGYIVTIPTAHIVGRQDALYEQGVRLYGMCEPRNAELYDHGGKHSIPFDRERNNAMVAVIKRAIERAERGGGN
ncbi:serine hydrolase FSH [Aspergillus undulatus]|uniref:serine hydrolase FSH n=1 Tax=Aspergillus undulatus TaxID=1810928 RepID=UPI003CCD3CF0